MQENNAKVGVALIAKGSGLFLLPLHIPSWDLPFQVVSPSHPQILYPWIP